MSEYQYNEFQAADRPLSEKEMRELRALTAREDHAEECQPLAAQQPAAVAAGC